MDSKQIPIILMKHIQDIYIYIYIQILLVKKIHRTVTIDVRQSETSLKQSTSQIEITSVFLFANHR